MNSDETASVLFGRQKRLDVTCVKSEAPMRGCSASVTKLSNEHIDARSSVRERRVLPAVAGGNMSLKICGWNQTYEQAMSEDNPRAMMRLDLS
eukprot:5845539-Pleurochrysis_carterae.AAC.1